MDGGTKYLVMVVLIVALAIGGVCGGMVYAGSLSNERENRLGQACIEAGGSWVRHSSGPQCIK